MTAALRVGTRGSPLALAQTEEVVGRLLAIRPDLRTETIVIRTHGDEDYREDLGTGLDGKRAFTKRIEEALLGGRIDFAVHSLKDLPTEMVDGVTIAAIPPREDPRDVLVGRDAISPDDLGRGVRVGTSSLRRRAQLLSRWPGLEVKELHGNVGTRLRRLDSNDFDAIVVAAAGLHRLRVEDRRTFPLPPNIMTPAPGQGALALEARAGDRPVLDLLFAVDDPITRRATEAERALSARIGGACNIPFGALATLERGITLHAVLADPDGRRIVRSEDHGEESRWKEVVDSVWRKLVHESGGDLIPETARMEKLPFRGRTFLVAASEDLVDKLAQAVREKGGHAIPFPTIRLVPPKDYADLDRGLRLWQILDWVVFTSAHGVEAVVERARALGVDLSLFQGNVATVGPATRAAAEAAGLPVSVVPDEFLTDAIAGALGDVCGQTILLPRSSIARKSLTDELRDRGAKVIEADAYDPVPATPDVSLVRVAARIDIVLLTSASAATHLMGLLPQDVRDRLIKEAEAACIGPVTAEAARSLGFRVCAVAREHTVPGLVGSLAEVRAHG